MQKTLKSLALFSFILVWGGIYALTGYAHPHSESTRKLLEKSLSLMELDREIQKILKVKKKITTNISALELQIQKQEQGIATVKKEAGTILYYDYIGKNDLWLKSLISAKSFKDFMYLFYMSTVIIENGSQKLQTYFSSTKKLKKDVSKLHHKLQEHETVTQKLIINRERMTKIKNQIAVDLNITKEKETTIPLIRELETYWKKIGLAEVKASFNILEGAMNHFPDYLAKTPGILKIEGFNATFTISEKQFAQFLRQEHPHFQSIQFLFADNRLIIKGKKRNFELVIVLKGSVVQKPENAVMFQIENLILNDLKLPKTTIEDLESEFDLGLYPSQIASFLKAKKIELKNHLFRVDLSLK